MGRASGLGQALGVLSGSQRERPPRWPPVWRPLALSSGSRLTEWLNKHCMWPYSAHGPVVSTEKKGAVSSAPWTPRSQPYLEVISGAERYGGLGLRTGVLEVRGSYGQGLG